MLNFKIHNQQASQFQSSGANKGTKKSKRGVILDTRLTKYQATMHTKCKATENNLEEKKRSIFLLPFARQR